MDILATIPVISRVTLYALLSMFGLFALIVLWAQVGCIKGKPFANPDGTSDDWREQKIFYGIAWADIVLACPLSFAAIAMVFAAPKWGFYLMGAASFWFVWTNLMTTVTSIHFEQPKITLQWLVAFPLGAVIGLAYVVWIIAHFGMIYGV